MKIYMHDFLCMIFYLNGLDGALNSKCRFSRSEQNTEFWPKLVSTVLFIKWVRFFDHMLIIYVSISYVSWKYEVKREKRLYIWRYCAFKEQGKLEFLMNTTLTDLIVHFCLFPSFVFTFCHTDRLSFDWPENILPRRLWGLNCGIVSAVVLRVETNWTRS